MFVTIVTLRPCSVKAKFQPVVANISVLYSPVAPDVTPLILM